MDEQVPIKLLLPFYQQVFVELQPYKSPTEFRKRVGLTVEELVTLFEENQVIPVMVGHLYLYEGLDFLMPILDERPPTMLRLDYAERLFWGSIDRATRYAIDANANLAGRFKDLAKKYESWFPRSEKHRTIEEQLELESIERYKRLSYFGYNWLAKAISGMDDMACVYYQLGLCNNFLVSTFLGGGFPQYSRGVFDIFTGQQFDAKGKKVRIFEKSFKEEPVFPSEIARMLVTREEKQLRVLFPSEITLSDVLSLVGDSAFQKARKALHEFSISIEVELARDEILDKKAALHQVWDETREAIESMKLTAKSHKWCLWGIGMGVLGTLAITLAGFPGLLSLVGISVALDKIIQPDASMAYERANSLPIAIYELEKLISRVSS